MVKSVLCKVGVSRSSWVVGSVVLAGAIAAIAASGFPGLAIAKTRDAGRSIASSQAKQAKAVEQEILAAHNKYRQEVGVPDLTWSPTLAAHAQAWADQLASTGKFEHSTDPHGEGENLAKGTAGSYSATQLVDMWGGEKQNFQPGTFPDVSTTGNWMDVGHYTQLVWRDTTQVGCGLATGGGSAVLVCRYSPPGNYEGEPVY